jgi:DNA-binding SARP family transcriptional activator
MEESESSPRWSAESHSAWRRAYELLKAGQYERVAELLGKAQVASEQKGDSSLAQILAAARRICLACRQCRAEVEWHQHACEEAGQREHELKQQLYAIFDLISGRETPETPRKPEALSPVPMDGLSLPERDAPESVGRLSLWQRIQSLLGQAPSLRFAKHEVLMPISLSAERAEAPVAGSIGRQQRQEKKGLPSLVIYCLGSFRVYQNDQLTADWDSLKARSIFKYLVMHRGTPITKDILMEVFWPEAEPEAARRNLHQAIYSLRQTLRRRHPSFQHIQFENDCYLLNPEMDIWLDCEEFEKHAQAGQRIEAAGRLAEAMAEYGIAEGLYQGDFLEEDVYEDWIRWHREHIRNTYLNLTDHLSEYFMQQGEYTATIALSQKTLAQDKCYEEAHRRLMQCYLAQGQRHLAIRQYQACVETLKEELDLAPSEDTLALYRHITAA